VVKDLATSIFREVPKHWYCTASLHSVTTQMFLTWKYTDLTFMQTIWLLYRMLHFINLVTYVTWKIWAWPN